ncbi:MAG TPA: TA system VapC family ribonuclease toxin [Candidatus Acidoferrum sp.]|nr:TA system VapC family ribonuclease toxin [Candidatus Acidoferrum sp.]
MKAGFLLDVNVLIAMAWPRHLAHGKVQEWLSRHQNEAWATCPFTQAAFVRLSSNPGFSPDALSPSDSLSVLESNVAHASHQFWADDISLMQALEGVPTRLTGHQQVTGAYLLGLAIHKKGKLATMDRGIVDLLPEKTRAGEFVELI